MNLYSRRNKPKPTAYSYEFSPIIRSRIMHTLAQSLGGRIQMPLVLFQLRDILLREYGALRRREGKTFQHDGEDIDEHITACPDDEFCDILELVFQVDGYAYRQAGVSAFNQIFDDENLGYELTSFVIAPVERDINGRPKWSGSINGPLPPGSQYPKMILRGDRLIHSEVVGPALKLLADPRFSQANAEFVDGLVHLRKGEFDDAITSCGAAIESLLKTICTAKGWAYDPHKDTCSKLLDICREKGLFHPFYKPILEGTATIRNKVGDAHGKGPNPEYVATKELADHMVHTCCSNILLLVSLAKF